MVGPRLGNGPAGPQPERNHAPPRRTVRACLISRGRTSRAYGLGLPLAARRLQQPIRLPTDLDEVALHRGLRLTRIQGLVSRQQAGVSLSDGDLDPGETLPDGRDAADVVTGSVGERDTAKFEAGLADNWPRYWRLGRTWCCPRVRPSSSRTR